MVGELEVHKTMRGENQDQLLRQDEGNVEEILVGPLLVGYVPLTTLSSTTRTFGVVLIIEFKQLTLKCNLVELEENTITRFIGGLNPSITILVQLQSYWTITDIINLSLKVEK